MRRIYRLSQALYNANESDVVISQITTWILAEIKDRNGITTAWVPEALEIVVEFDPNVFGIPGLDNHVRAVLRVLRGKRGEYPGTIFEGVACFPFLNGNEPIAVSTDASGTKFEV